MTQLTPELKTALEELADKYSYYIGDSLSDFEMVSGRSVILPNDIQLMLNAAYILGKHDGNKWVSVSDRLPEKDGIYLVWGSAYADTPRQVLRCNYYKKIFTSDNCGGVKTKNVTHWQPLPSPPTDKTCKIKSND